MAKRKIGILGYGNVGKFLADQILNNESISSDFELSFVWNRSAEKLEALDEKYRLVGTDLSDVFLKYLEHNDAPDLIVEVAHSQVLKEHAQLLLLHSDMMITTITALAERQTEEIFMNASQTKSIYLATGAAWGVEDIVKMDRLQKLENLKVSMYFNADALKLQSPLKESLAQYVSSEEKEAFQLYKGDVRTLAGLAPNNVNTMCCLALAGASRGLDQTIGNLYAKKQGDTHLVEIECFGPNGFYVKTQRYNPAKKGAVTGDQTYFSFLASMINAQSKEAGIHFC